MREETVERHLCDQVRKEGGIAYKFRSPNRKHVPDRLCLFPDGVTIFVETKRPGEKPRPGQEREHKRLRSRGHRVEVVDSKAGVQGVIDMARELRGIERGG